MGAATAVLKVLADIQPPLDGSGNSTGLDLNRVSIPINIAITSRRGFSFTLVNPSDNFIVPTTGIPIPLVYMFQCSNPCLIEYTATGFAASFIWAALLIMANPNPPSPALSITVQAVTANTVVDVVLAG